MLMKLPTPAGYSPTLTCAMCCGYVGL